MARTHPGAYPGARPGTHGRATSPRAVALARLALAGIALYVAIDIALVFLRPGLSVLHSAESEYGSVGPWAWLMDLNFLIRCGLSLAAVGAILAASLPSRPLRAGLALIAVWAVCSGLLALLPADAAGAPATRTGAIHLLVALVAFAAVAAGTIVASPALGSQPPWRPTARLLGAIAWVALVPLALLLALGLGAHTLGAAVEKLFLALELLWLAVVCLAIALASAPARA